MINRHVKDILESNNTSEIDSILLEYVYTHHNVSMKKEENRRYTSLAKDINDGVLDEMIRAARARISDLKREIQAFADGL